VQQGIEGQRLTPEDQLLILMQTGLYLTATRGHSTPEVRLCYERAETLCHSLDDPLTLFSALIGQWRNSLLTAKLSATMQLAQRAYSLAEAKNEPALMMGAFRILAVTFYFSGEFEAAQRCARRGVQLWHAGGVQPRFEEVNSPAVVCLSFEALCKWHFGESASSHTTMAEAISLAKELGDTYALAVALFHAGFAGHFERDPAEVERLASDLIELATRQNFAQWRAGAFVFRGWARSASGGTAEGVAWVEEGIKDWRALGSTLIVPYWLGLKAEVLHFTDCLAEALKAIREAEKLAEISGEYWWSAELHRLRGVFLAAMGADDTEIEAAFHESIRVAKQQKSFALLKRAEASYADYRGEKE
jgi:predicted ATPase